VLRLVVLGCLASTRLAFAQPAPPAPPAPTTPTGPSTPAPAPVKGQRPALGFGLGTKDTTTKESASAVEARHAAAALCTAHDPSCDWIATFSSLEKRSIIRTLLRRGLDAEPEPWGKLIDEVVVENEDVFAEDNWLQFFNNFHYTTREGRVREELTIQAGEVWDQDRVEESARRLHDPLYTSVVALFPVKSSVPGRVKLLVVTRDIWSLRLNTLYTFQQGALTNLSFSLSENNFLGTRDVVAAAVVMDPGAISVGPLFIDKDFLGKHIDFRVRFDDILTRQHTKFLDATGQRALVPGDPDGLQDATTLHSEGADATIQFGRPLWSLATEWGWGTSFTYKNAVARSFSGQNMFDDPYVLYTDPGSGLPYEYRARSWSVNANGVRQWGDDYKQQINFGYTLSSFRASLVDSFSAFDPAALAKFEEDVFPRTEVISQPFVGYAFFRPRYRTVRNVSTYELAEDVNLGPSGSVTVAQGLRALGGDFNFTRPSASIGYIWPWLRDGFIHPSASVSMRFQGDAPHGWSSIDNNASVVLRFATPTISWFRVVVQGEVDTRWHDTQNNYYVIGSDSGLRGYNVNAFRSSTTSESSRRATGQVELRTVPVPFWVLRLGAVAFYETGGVASSLQKLNLYNDVGLGVRMLVPQTSRELFRFDIAFPLQATPNNAALFPHFLAGFESYF